MKCDVCGNKIFKAKTIITGSTLEAWCYKCFKQFQPDESRIFDPENETWEIRDEESGSKP